MDREMLNGYFIPNPGELKPVEEKTWKSKEPFKLPYFLTYNPGQLTHPN